MADGQGPNMTPNELRTANVRHFQRLLEHTTDTDERARIQRLLNEELSKPVHAYPAERDRSPT